MHIFLIHNRWGSAHHRGIDASRITNGKIHHCGHSNLTKAAIFVHVKYVCDQAMKQYEQAYHVFDRIDNFRKVNLKGFSGEIVSTESQLRECSMRVCAVIPHHINLSCRFHSQLLHTPPNIGFVGTSTRVPATLVKKLHAFPTRHEKLGELCLFYDNIDIAIAWKNEKNKPNERFSNPVWFGIPTIGSVYNTAFTEYKNAASFLCYSEDCVIDRVYGIQNRSLTEKFLRLRAEVRNDVNSRSVTRMYFSMFQMLFRNSTRRAIAPLI